MKRELICWDTSVLIDWIKGNTAPKDRLSFIKSVVQEVKNGTYQLAVSTLIYPEVLATKMPNNKAIEKFRGFMQNREWVEIVAVDIRVAEKAQDIRNDLRNISLKIETPDAVHIATAIVSGAKLFHTFDKALLKLDKKDEVDGLAITACHTPKLKMRPLF